MRQGISLALPRQCLADMWRLLLRLAHACAACALPLQMAAKWSIPTSRITITNVYKGSIVVELNIDTSGLAQNQLQDIVGAITYNPSSVFDAVWLSANKITGVTARVTQPPSAGLNVPAIVGGVVGGVGGAAVIGGTTWFILKKR